MTDDRSQSWSSLTSTDRVTLAAAPHRCCSYGTHPSRTTRGHGALPPHHDGTQPRSTPPLAPLGPPPRLAPQRHDRSTSPCRARWPHRRPGRRHPPPRGHPRFPQSRPPRLPPPPPLASAQHATAACVATATRCTRRVGRGELRRRTRGGTPPPAVAARAPRVPPLLAGALPPPLRFRPPSSLHQRDHACVRATTCGTSNPRRPPRPSLATHARSSRARGPIRPSRERRGPPRGAQGRRRRAQSRRPPPPPTFAVLLSPGSTSSGFKA